MNEITDKNKDEFRTQFCINMYSILHRRLAVVASKTEKLQM